MIEDALQSTRTVARLLLAASVVAVVFLLSIDDATEQRRLLASIERLQSLPHQEYDAFVNARIKAEVADELESLTQSFAEALDTAIESQELKILGSGRITSVFEQPAHVGRIRPSDLSLTDQDATLDQLDQIFALLPTDQDVQLVILDPSPLLDEIVDFLVQSTAGGLLGPEVSRIDNVQLYTQEYASETGETFLPMDVKTTPLVLTFELHTPAGIPIFQSQPTGRFRTVPESSWEHWLREHARAGDLVAMVEGQNHWVPEVKLGNPERSRPLSEVRSELQSQIEDVLAETRTLDLPGIEIPGSLALVGIPLTLLGLSLSLRSHLQHLHRLAPEHSDTFRQFAWAAINQPLAAQWELGGTLLLALFANVLLAWKVTAFEVPVVLALTPPLLGFVGLALLGVSIFFTLRRIRWKVRSG